MKQIKADEFVKLARQYPVLDVRSPGEYSHAHIPGAYSLPLFTDEERKVVGTLYKQQGKQDAVKSGLDYFGVKMRKMVEAAEAIVASHRPVAAPHAGTDLKENTILVHCWRGGMRSGGVAWLLDLYGFNVMTLAGGYKAYRNWVLHQFEKPYPFKIVGGYTGSGKTELLKQLVAGRELVIDLEGIAHHKGSAFGALGEAPQPGQEQFENLLAEALWDKAEGDTGSKCIWLEDESKRIGLVNLPVALWETMQQAPLVFMDIPFEERLKYITEVYGRFKKEDLINAVVRIQKRLGGQQTKNAVNYLLEGNTRESFRILLAYYDKFYGKDLEERKKKNKEITEIKCERVDAKGNYKKLMGL